MVFTVLRAEHSSNCWKVMCKLMDSNSPVTNCNFSFLKEVTPYICVELQLKKKQAESKIKEICGNHYADPNSPIDKAWKNYQKCEKEYKEMKRRYEELRCLKEKQLFPLKEELIFTSASTEQEREKFRLSRKITQIFEKSPVMNLELNRKKGEKFRLYNAYKKLELERKRYESIRKSSQHHLSALNSNPLKFLPLHAQSIHMERECALNLEKDLKSRLYLEECLATTEKLIEAPEQQSPEAFEWLRQKINDLPYEDKKYVWESIYFECTGGLIKEDAWAENHFPDYLKTLQHSIDNCLFWVNFRIDS